MYSPRKRWSLPPSSANAGFWQLAGYEDALDVAPRRMKQESRRLPGDTGDVRREQKLARRFAFEGQERIVGGWRLGGVNVDGGASQVAGLKAIGERCFV